jgi:diguanylate cyclase (GGDEF)-like protein
MPTVETLLAWVILAGAGFVAGWLAASRRARHRIERIEQFRQAALAEARRDPLTGLWNRRSFEEQLAHHAAVSRRYGTPLALVLIDVDDLKATNDRLGYAAGDDLLRHLASNLSRTIREADLAFRFGGDEFGVMLLQAGPEMAAGFVNRLRAQLAAEPAGAALAGAEPIGADAARLPVRVSFGVAYLPGAATARELVAQADRALKCAKEAGHGQAFMAANDRIEPLETLEMLPQAFPPR